MKYKRNLKKLISLIANIHPCRGDSIIFNNTTLCMPLHKSFYVCPPKNYYNLII